MSQQSGFNLYDGAATPVQHALMDCGITRANDGTTIALWREALSTVPQEAQFRRTQLQRTLKSQVIQSIIRYELPVMESIGAQNSSGYTAAPKVAFVDRIDVIGYAHPRSTEATRKVLTQMVLNDLGNVSTSVAAVTAGFSMYLLQKLFQPT